MKRPLAVATAALCLTLATSAHAGTYDVKACYTMPGNGWLGNGSWVPEPGFYVSTGTNCTGEGIATRMNGGTAPYGAGGRHRFTAPPYTRIVRFRANVKAFAWDGWYAGLVDNAPQWVWGGGPFTTWDQYSWVDIGVNTGQLFAQVTCGDFNGCRRAGNLGYMIMKDVVVTIEDNGAPELAITGGSVTTGGWKNGGLDVSYWAGDTTGIRTVEILVDGHRQLSNAGRCDEVYPRPCDDKADTKEVPATSFGSDGRHTVTVRAFDGAGNSRDAIEAVLVDRTPPGQPLDTQLDGPNTWRQQNAFGVTWRNPTQTAAPIVAARYTLCPATNTAGDSRGCIAGRRRERNLVSLSNVRVPSAGAWRLKLWLEDEAGNHDLDRSVSIDGLRLDETPPTVAFAAPTKSDPTRVRVVAADTPSGVAQGQVEVRREGESAWRSLATTLDRSGFWAVINDETLPKGEYEFRARAVDHAGNERSTQVLENGRPANRTLPLRVGTRLAVGKPKRVRAKGANGRRYRTILVMRPRAGYGRTIPLSGRLTMPGANPLAGADVVVWERIDLPSAVWRRIGLVRTSRTGRFRYKALRGPSRVLRFRYPGTETIRPRATEVDLRVRARTSFRVSNRRAVNGEEITFRGRLKGRQMGDTGKLVHVQVYTRGRWSTFATPRAHRRTGVWRVPYRFTATRGRVEYRFRAVVPREASFPYDPGASRSVRVTVQGL